MHKTGTNVRYEFLLDERGDNGAFADTLWGVRCVTVSFITRTKRRRNTPSPTSNMRTSLRILLRRKRGEVNEESWKCG
jgi:hypothetical protein